MSISPFFRSPFTDITGGLVSHQMPGQPCAPLELEAMECLEAYGLDRGMKKCRCLLEDLDECTKKTKQFLRFMAMRAERDRQIACGKLKGDEKYMSPRMDSY